MTGNPLYEPGIRIPPHNALTVPRMPCSDRTRYRSWAPTCIAVPHGCSRNLSSFPIRRSASPVTGTKHRSCSAPASEGTPDGTGTAVPSRRGAPPPLPARGAGKRTCRFRSRSFRTARQLRSRQRPRASVRGNSRPTRRAAARRRLPRPKRLQPDQVRRLLQDAVHGFHGRQGTHRRGSELRG